MTDSKSTTNKTTMSDHNPDIMKSTIVFKNTARYVRYNKLIIDD